MASRISPAIVAAISTIAASSALMAWPPTLAAGVMMLTCLSVAVFFYNLVWLYGKIDHIIGGMPKVSFLYLSAFVFLLSGYGCVAAWFLSRKGWLGLLGGFLIVVGILLAQGSNALLLEYIVYGRRWRLAKPSSGSG